MIRVCRRENLQRLPKGRPSRVRSTTGISTSRWSATAGLGGIDTTRRSKRPRLKPGRNDAGSGATGIPSRRRSPGRMSGNLEGPQNSHNISNFAARHKCFIGRKPHNPNRAARQLARSPFGSTSFGGGPFSLQRACQSASLWKGRSCMLLNVHPCGTKLDVPDLQIGQIVRCPKCRGSITVGSAPEPAQEWRRAEEIGERLASIEKRVRFLYQIALIQCVVGGAAIVTGFIIFITSRR
jgi:hypothetical protein